MINYHFKPQSIRTTGFTLVELLVVIFIISVLIALLLPALAAARQEALSVACLSNEQQLGLGVTQYATDNKGSMPFYNFKGLWVVSLLPYMDKARRALLCPATTTPPIHPTPSPNGTVSTAWDWAYYGGYDYMGSYTFNGWLYGGAYDTAIPTNQGFYPRNQYLGINNGYWPSQYKWQAMYWPANMLSINGASRIPLFTDGVWPDCWLEPTDPAPPNLISPLDQGWNATGGGPGNVAFMYSPPHAGREYGISGWPCGPSATLAVVAAGVV
jgi:prepilin-type N-terminal cleavage/methylation domain-containing protein